MDMLVIFIISSIVLNTCPARKYSSASTEASSILLAVILVPTLIGSCVITIVIVCCCYKKAPWCRPQGRDVMLIVAQQVLAQQQNPYAPPGFSQTTFYDQPPPYSQIAPYKKSTLHSESIQTS
ncbi:unnamed protein product [Adineta steineri]|uniref:Uncharacterized protein n=1 Tax=Adineta steineri TaxID=433720 RepID=A0A814RN88_9BILA|nr:unnamed protein product [Adineta steineri]CAF1462509.1 unnamed protein product [Adineta steineri]